MKFEDLPKNINEILSAEYGADISLSLAKKFGLNELGEVRKITSLLTAGFLKEIKLTDLVSAVKSEFKFADKKATDFVIEFLGKRFLMVDDEWFKGDVSKTIESLGGDPELFIEDNKKYLAEVEKEKEKEKKEKREEEEEKKETEDYFKKMEQGEGEIDFSGEEISEEDLKEIFQVKDPVEEKKEFISLFSDSLMGLANSKNIALKIYLNNHLIQLLSDDKNFYQELLNTITHSKELITKEEIKIDDSKKEPTVENWLQDFYSSIENGEDRVSSLRKAQYFSESKNVKSLKKEEKEKLDNLLDLYANIRNFYSDLERLTLADLFLFPVSDKEKADLQEIIKLNEESKLSKVSDSEENIFKLYLGRPEEQELIKSEVIKITQETRLEYDQVAEKFEDYLLRRDRVGVIASLKILSDIGVLDDLVFDDARFRDYLVSYFRRNSLEKQLVEYQKNIKDSKFIKYFLKYVLQERLGMVENEAARIGLHLANIFRKQGLESLSHLAYFDLKDKKFKWN